MFLKVKFKVYAMRVGQEGGVNTEGQDLLFNACLKVMFKVYAVERRVERRWIS